MLIDAHTHLIPRAYLRELERSPVASLAVRGSDGERPVVSTSGVDFPLSPIWIAPAAVVRRMDETGVAAHVVSPPTFLFHYPDPVARALELATVVNDAYAGLAQSFPGRFSAMGTVPLQSLDAACGELSRLVRDLEMRAVAVGTSVNGRSIADPSFDVFFREAERLEVFVFIHPTTQHVLAEEHLGFAYLRNLIGLPLSTAYVLESIIFGGLLTRYPRLKLGFAHGGGVSSSLLARWQETWDAMPDRPTLSPLDAFRMLYFDTVIHAPAALELLLAYADPTRVLLGSDYPADMGCGVPGPIATTGLYASPLGELIRAGNARTLFF